MENFLLSLELASPLVVTHRLMLDALLAGCMAKWPEYRENPQAAIDAVPIARTSQGIAHASQWLWGDIDPARADSFSLCQSFARDLIGNSLLHAAVHDLPREVKVGRGRYRNIDNTYMTIAVKEVFFLARGDVESVRSILSDLSGIGSQRNKGMGSIKKVVIDIQPEGHPLFGIIGGGHVLRPIPLRFAADFPDPVSHAVLAETWCNPYGSHFEGAIVEPCMVPDFMTTETFDSMGIHRLMSP